eukprot:TRINITY_DN3776_c0_g1_i4.p2 TRINITY_DN3776_c0_g1~~TRINITY_DN3776_c0_g1_i4.p2  ORF type:complete len:354 (-),score=26.12 TRINITY_DN3776_c0_g1_i4:1407-2408(-)
MCIRDRYIVWICWRTRALGPHRKRKPLLMLIQPKMLMSLFKAKFANSHLPEKLLFLDKDNFFFTSFGSYLTKAKFLTENKEEQCFFPFSDSVKVIKTLFLISPVISNLHKLTLKDHLVFVTEPIRLFSLTPTLSLSQPKSGCSLSSQPANPYIYLYCREPHKWLMTNVGWQESQSIFYPKTFISKLDYDDLFILPVSYPHIAYLFVEGSDYLGSSPYVTNILNKKGRFIHHSDFNISFIRDQAPFKRHKRILRVANSFGHQVLVYNVINGKKLKSVSISIFLHTQRGTNNTNARIQALNHKIYVFERSNIGYPFILTTCLVINILNSKCQRVR